jgi:hypothetical protein
VPKAPKIESEPLAAKLPPELPAPPAPIVKEYEFPDATT